MRELDSRWWKGLALVVSVALIVVAVHVFTTTPFDAAELTATSTATTSYHVTPSPTATSSATPRPTATSRPTETPSPTLTPSPTPPQPTATPTLTPTPSPTPLPKWIPTPVTFLPGTPTPTPVVVTRTNSITETLTLTAPEPLPLVDQRENVINVLLLGSDQIGTEQVGRTDTIVVVSIHPELPSVSLLSIPRDFYAWVPGRGFEKINTVFSRGGPALMKATILQNFGIPIDYHARVGFDSFARIVDALGGVEVAVECPLHDTFPDPASPSGTTDVDWEPGIHHLDGKHALWYARSRWSTSDFDRHRRQQQVLRGLYRRAMSLGIIPKIPSIWSAWRDSVSTDLDLQGLIRLGAIGARLDTTYIKSRFVDQSVLTSWRGPEGMYLLLPDHEALASLVRSALAPPQPVERRPLWRVEVVNGAPRGDWGLVAAERLRWEGFGVVDVRAADGPQIRTQIIDLTTASDPGSATALSQLMRLYKRRPDDVITSPTEDRGIDFQVLLGLDYDPCAAVRSR